MGLVEDLAKIRQLQGKDPLPDPFHIQGFGPGHPPSPEARPTPIELDDLDDPEDLDVEDREPETLRSPMVPRSKSKTAPEPSAGQNVVPAGLVDVLKGLKLVVIDHLGYFAGVETTLNEEEVRQVSVIVIGAQQRVLAEHLASLRVGAATSRTGSIGDGGASEHGDDALPLPSPKKRGRPRKS